MKKKDKKGAWKRMGLILTSKEEFEEIYERYIKSTHCELCGESYKSNYDKHMDHCHFIDIYGWFRNVICRTCNLRKSDNKIYKSNISGHKLIHKHASNHCKQGYYWEFQVVIDGKTKCIKTSTDLDFLVKFKDKWVIDNNYYT